MHTEKAAQHGRWRALVWAGLVILVVAAGLGLASRQARANNIAPFQTVFATDVVSAGYGGMRGDGTGTITLSGVSGTITQALLYWHGPTESGDTAANESPTFAGSGITGTNIGLSDNNCWGFENSQAYRADVTSLVTGDAAYALADFVGTDSLGNDVDINGVSLIVFFDDGDDTNNRNVVIFDGNDSNVPGNPFDADGWNVTLPGINYDSGSASMELHVADGQGSEDANLILNGTTTLASGPDVFQGDTVPNLPSATGPNVGLWDIRSFDVTSSLTPGDNTLALTLDYINDCLSLIVVMVNLPAGAAPGQPPTDTPVAPQPTATFASSVAAAVTLPQTGAGAQGSGGPTGWLIAALLSSAALAAAGYGALHLRPNGRP